MQKETNVKDQRNEDGFNAIGLLGFLVGFLSGGLIGALVMLFMAPRTGKQTRSQIQKKGAKLRRQVTEGMEDVVAGAADKAHEFTDSVNNSVHKGVTDLKQQTQGMINEGG